MVVWVIIRHWGSHLVKEAIRIFQLLSFLRKSLRSCDCTVNVICNSAIEISKFCVFLITQLDKSLSRTNSFWNIVNLLGNIIYKFWFTQVVDVILVLLFHPSVFESILLVYWRGLTIFLFLATKWLWKVIFQTLASFPSFFFSLKHFFKLSFFKSLICSKFLV